MKYVRFILLVAYVCAVFAWMALRGKQFNAKELEHL